MNSFVTLTCLLAVAGVSHGSAIGLSSLGLGLGGLDGLGLGLGGLGLDPLLLKSPISVPIVKTIAEPIIIPPVPIIKKIPLISPINPYISPISPVIKNVVPISSLGLGPIAPLPLAYSSLGSYGLGGLGLNGLGLSKGLGYGSIIKH